MNVVLIFALQLLKDAPEIVDLLTSLKASGRTDPTDDEIAALKQTMIDRGAEDQLWDNFGKTTPTL